MSCSSVSHLPSRAQSIEKLSIPINIDGETHAIHCAVTTHGHWGNRLHDFDVEDDENRVTLSFRANLFGNKWISDCNFSFCAPNKLFFHFLGGLDFLYGNTLSLMRKSIE